MKSLPAPYPRLAIEEIEELLIPPGASTSDHVELVISIDEKNLRIRGLSDLLGFIDRTYGRLYPKGIRSYALRENEHVNITKVKKGSWELVIDALIENREAVTTLLMIRLAVKYLPGILESLSSSYKNYQEAMYTKQKRKALRNQMQQDDELKSLKRNRQDQLAQFIDYLYESDVTMVRNASKFCRKSTNDVFIQIKSQDKET
jgi:hypothetical protein